MNHVARLLCSALAALLLFPAAPMAAAKLASSYLVYFGTYTGPKSKGVYVSRFDPKTGKLDAPALAGELTRPSWVTTGPSDRFLYAVSELGNNGKTEGAITSFSIDPASGLLTKLNTVSSGGGGACHLVVDKSGHAIMVADYGSGKVASFLLKPDGSIGEAVSVIQHSGSSTDPRRQAGPHAHAVVLSPDQRFLFVPDLGLDQIMGYKFDSATAKLTPNDPPFVKVKTGSGPRHLAFHPNTRWAYSISEMGSLVTAFQYDAKRGALTDMQQITTLPAGFSGENNSAEIGIHPNGRFVYASNRGADSITVFAIDRGTGRLTTVQNVPSGGKTPRNIQIDPSGRFLLAANQDTDNVLVFQLDPKSGKLTSTGQTIEVGAPVCIRFVPAR